MVAVHSTSLCWADFRLLCSIMDLPVPAKTMPTNTLNRVAECSKRTALNSMKQAAIDVHSSEGAIESTIPGVINCTVSFDASWHRRGHNSNQGFAGVIEADNGKVLDYVLYDRVCYQCSKWNQERKENEPDEYTSFWNTHKNFCTSNFSGSSQAMEGSAAVYIWARSVQLHQLHYSTYIGDGDSSSFKNLLNSNPYKSAIEIREEECLGHVRTTLKSRLKKKTSGSKCLSEPKAVRIAHLYALVVVQNRGKSGEEIQNGLQTLLSHSEEHHETCPQGSSSWCYFQTKLALYAANSSLPQPIPRQPYLTESDITRTKATFETFAKLSLCQCLTLGKTQNPNESLHNMLWHNAPKAKRVGHKSLQCCTALAVLSFNNGSMDQSAVLNELGISVSHSTLKHLTERDHDRNLERVRRVKETQKRRRRQIVLQAGRAEASRKKRDTQVYRSGNFGAEGDSEA